MKHQIYRHTWIKHIFSVIHSFIQRVCHSLFVQNPHFICGDWCCCCCCCCVWRKEEEGWRERVFLDGWQKREKNGRNGEEHNKVHLPSLLAFSCVDFPCCQVSLGFPFLLAFSRKRVVCPLLYMWSLSPSWRCSSFHSVHFHSVLSISSNQMSSIFVIARGRGALFCCCRPSKHELLCSLLMMEEGRCCSISWSLFWSPRWGKNWTEMDVFLFFFVPENTRKIEERKAFSLLKKEWRLWCLCVCSLSHLWFTVYACVFVMMEEVSQAKSTTHRPPSTSPFFFLSSFFFSFLFSKKKGKK